VKHVKIFSSIAPDWPLVETTFSLSAKNTDALIGGVAKILADEGIQLADSTSPAEAAAAGKGCLTKRNRHRRREGHCLMDAVLRMRWPASILVRSVAIAGGLAWR